MCNHCQADASPCLVDIVEVVFAYSHEVGQPISCPSSFLQGITQASLVLLLLRSSVHHTVRYSLCLFYYCFLVHNSDDYIISSAKLSILFHFSKQIRRYLYKLKQPRATDAATTLHPTLFAPYSLIICKLRNVGCLSALHSPYIHPASFTSPFA